MRARLLFTKYRYGTISMNAAAIAAHVSQMVLSYGVRNLALARIASHISGDLDVATYWGCPSAELSARHYTGWIVRVLDTAVLIGGLQARRRIAC